eukprot:gb/GECH01014636.1/.p1 GENE.gb/GECH01014636.1/~~gb/GECH01014636.1/.p1  ORF type:complete len:289 (+),score=72.56 gb/GECH01014636.1/:1-867(+)
MTKALKPSRSHFSSARVQSLRHSKDGVCIKSKWKLRVDIEESLFQSLQRSNEKIKVSLVSYWYKDTKSEVKHEEFGPHNEEFQYGEGPKLEKENESESGINLYQVDLSGCRSWDNELKKQYPESSGPYKVFQFVFHSNSGEQARSEFFKTRCRSGNKQKKKRTSNRKRNRKPNRDVTNLNEKYQQQQKEEKINKDDNDENEKLDINLNNNELINNDINDDIDDEIKSIHYDRYLNNVELLYQNYATNYFTLTETQLQNFELPDSSILSDRAIDWDNKNTERSVSLFNL